MSRCVQNPRPEKKQQNCPVGDRYFRKKPVWEERGGIWKQIGKAEGRENL